MRTGEEYSELADLGSTYGGRYGGSTWSRNTPGRGAGRGAVAAEAEDVLGPNGTPRGPARSRSGLYYSPPGTSYTIVERPSSVMQHHTSREREFNVLASPRGTYLGSNPNFPTTRSSGRSNNKKRPISPEQVLRLFGNSATPQTNSKLNPERPRRSPASSPPSTTHQVNYRAPQGPSIYELTTRTVNMVREQQDAHGFGICVKGGKDEGVGVYISRVEEGSVAERAGLRPGDSILEVNGKPFTEISHEEALKMLKSCKTLSMTVRSPTMPSGLSGGAPWQMRQTCSWMDRHGRPVSPPLEYRRGGQVPPQRYGYGRTSSKDRSVRRVDLCIEPGQSLGLMIRGGVEYNLGIFITGVDKDSVADRAGLMVGDQILEVNGQSFMDVTHDEAVAQLKYHKRMSLVVRDVGKVPHSCTAYDRDWDLCSPGSRAAATTRKWAAALQMVEEKARCLLSRPEFTSLCYYTDEYAAKHMTIDAFVQVMTELLNTSEKITLMTELREIVAVDDRSKFDELVYGREPESSSRINPRDPREHDYRHSRRKGMPIPEANHTIFQSYSEDYGPEVDEKNYNDDFRSPSEDSGLGLGMADRLPRPRPASATGKTCNEDHHNQEYTSGDEDNTGGTRSRRHSSPGESRTGSTTALQEYPDSDQSGYLGGLRSSLGGWTQKVKSWYWVRPLELAHKLSRSFDLKSEQGMIEGGEMRRHQSMQRLSGTEAPREPARVVLDEEGNLRVTVRKTKPILGIAIEGGANTKHPLPRIININENGAAYSAGGLEVGQLILQVDGTRVEGLQHQDVARLIAESFARRDREDIEFLVVEAKKSNMEPKPTALIFLEA
ncbi:whirlin isoform X2 [Harmonia axyridis]|uniref:whirlin isoform X2 n=1 Tax=Harmonia axyridis TaxID=115357 RepID=UPI001E275B94|nr:whirlin isoform X2 [Harmonia axyridis]